MTSQHAHSISTDSPLISRTIKHPSWEECQLTLLAARLASCQWEQIEPFFNGNTTTILNADFFGQDERMAALSGEMRLREISGPETTLIPDKITAGGMQIGLLTGIDSIPILDEGRLIGRFFEDSDAKYCFLGNVQPTNPAASRVAQAGEVLQTIQSVLEGVGMHFRDVARTWFYVDQIIDWYDDFNRVRTAFFEQHGILRMPASTGIGAPNAAGTALVAKAVAVQPKSGNVRIKPVHSPLQCEAAAYGSSFSRGMEVSDLNTRTLYISGTASIEPGGKTVHVGDAAGQIEKTMEVVEALLVHAGMALTDTTRAIAYFRRREDIPLWDQYCRARQLPRFPIILTPSEICRDDLLFEIELDAVVEM